MSVEVWAGLGLGTAFFLFFHPFHASLCPVCRLENKLLDRLKKLLTKEATPL